MPLRMSQFEPGCLLTGCLLKRLLLKKAFARLSRQGVIKYTAIHGLMARTVWLIVGRWVPTEFSVRQVVVAGTFVSLFCESRCARDGFLQALDQRHVLAVEGHLIDRGRRYRSLNPQTCDKCVPGHKYRSTYHCNNRLTC